MKYDDKNLRSLFAALRPSKRRKVIKTACRRVGNVVTVAVKKNLSASGIHNADKLQKGVRTVVFNKEAGFRVTVASKRAHWKTRKGEKSMHRNGSGYKKPILAWAETGTDWRKTKRRKKVKFNADGKWVCTYTQRRGFMKRYGFIAKTREQIQSRVGWQLKDEIATQVTQIAKMYGCT